MAEALITAKTLICGTRLELHKVYMPEMYEFRIFAKSGLVTKIVLEILPEELTDIVKFFRSGQDTIKKG